MGRKRQEHLTRALRLVYLERKKDQVLKNELTNKDELVMFCPLTSVQRRIYRTIMSLPDYHLLRTSTAPCDCGVNRRFFLGYKKMRNRKEQIEYQRRHKGELVLRKDCCYRAPYTIREEGSAPVIDPNAVLWRNMHPGDVECSRSQPPFCPHCILLPALNKLYKVCSHATLLQVEKNPDMLVEGTQEWKKFNNELNFARVALTPQILESLPGKSYLREDGIMNNHLELSGKMQRLHSLLKQFNRQHDRVLIFSYSTKTLNLIQHYVQSEGYSYTRLDGTTPTKKRQALVDEFQIGEIFLFLISTKAGGLGLNLTAANKVIGELGLFAID